MKSYELTSIVGFASVSVLAVLVKVVPLIVGALLTDPPAGIEDSMALIACRTRANLR